MAYRYYEYAENFYCYLQYFVYINISGIILRLFLRKMVLLSMSLNSNHLSPRRHIAVKWAMLFSFVCVMCLGPLYATAPNIFKKPSPKRLSTVRGMHFNEMDLLVSWSFLLITSRIVISPALK